MSSYVFGGNRDFWGKKRSILANEMALKDIRSNHFTDNYFATCRTIHNFHFWDLGLNFRDFRVVNLFVGKQTTTIIFEFLTGNCLIWLLTMDEIK